MSPRYHMPPTPGAGVSLHQTTDRSAPCETVE